MKSMCFSVLWMVCVSSAACAAVPTVVVDRDDVVIRESCIIAFSNDAAIADENNNGVIHIEGSDITVEFADGAALRGAPAGTPWNELVGYGIRVKDAKNVTLKNISVHGFKGGVFATNADGLTVENADLSDNFRQRLHSTPAAEAGQDWLRPHHNDKNEWLRNYGAALYIEDSDGVTVRNVFVRRGQNGIVIDRVNHSKIYDNDASFLSGWGLAMWRSSDNVISRNAFDFCVRGHSEGIYNRGQDSAGILMFEQCNRNIIAHNSCTHGGDGIFGFAGLEALGQPNTIDKDLDYKRIGCNDNLFINNDLSYAPAHGLEMTFSFGNKIVNNRFVENAICGVWGGFSQETYIAENFFDGNGGMAYGLERGGINIEHSINNVIYENIFQNNRVAIHLWYDNPGDIPSFEWGKKNYGPLANNRVIDNTFNINNDPRPFYRNDNEKRIGLWLRDDGKTGNVKPVLVRNNRFNVDERVGAAMNLQDDTSIQEISEPFTSENLKYEVLGKNQPIEARKELRGRHMIIMDEWGPWDHQSPLLRVTQKSGNEHLLEILGGDVKPNVSLDGLGVQMISADHERIEGASQVTLKAENGVKPYAVTVTIGDWQQTVRGTLIDTTWNVRFFNYDPDVDPREKPDEWPRVRAEDASVEVALNGLDFPYGWGGPSDQKVPQIVRDAKIKPDRFGMIATATTQLPAGKWRITTQSDDGVRVLVNDKPVIDNWTWHVTATDKGTFTVKEGEDVTIKAMHFELDGAAVFKLELEPAE